MSDNLIDLVAPRMHPPVTRAPFDAAAEDGAEQSVFGVTIGGFTFADDGDE